MAPSRKKLPLWIALGMVAGVSTASVAQGISDDVVRIGFITDMSSVYSDPDGTGGLEAVRMAIEDAGGEVGGKKIELLYADHQNKADIASARAREWFDREGLDALFGGSNSAAALANAAVAAEKQKPFISVGAGAAALHNEQCTPWTIHYAYDTTMLARGTGAAVVRDGGKSWFFMTADYTFGHTLERDTAAVVKQAGGDVIGSVRVPLGAADMSAFVVQAQASGAQILGLANASGDTINSIRTAHDFGVTNTMKLAGLIVFALDVHAVGLESAQGMYLTSGWYWDQSDASRAFSARFEQRVGRKPSFVQAADYSAVSFYLRGVREIGTDDPATVMRWMKSNPINDMFTTGGKVRKDGRMIYDVYLRQVKTPAESKYPWDYFNTVAKLDSNEVYIQPQESVCPLWKE